MRKIKVWRREVYGRALFYPRCHVSRSFCAFLGKKTLSERDLTYIKVFDFGVDFVLDFEEELGQGEKVT